MKHLRTALLASGLIALIALSSSAGFTEHALPHTLGEGMLAWFGDVDQDGWGDIVTCDGYMDSVVWLKNDGTADFLPAAPIGSSLIGAIQARPVDLDLDGDVDVVAALWTSSEFLWWENDGALGFTRHSIGAHANAHTALPVDIDEDGDLDLVVCGNTGGSAWWENDGLMNFSRHSLIEAVTSQYADFGDLDGDGDIDLLTNDYDTGVRWWENDGSENFTTHVLPLIGAHGVRAYDMDGDDDLDIVCAAYNPTTLKWWENDGTGSFTMYDIATATQGLLTADPDDFDWDGDIDICGVAEQSDDVIWWENDGAMGFTEHILADGTLNSGQTCWAFDIDSDGDGDILAAGRFNPSVRWYENDAVTCEIATNVQTGIAPVTVQFSDTVTSPVAATGLMWDLDGDGTPDASGHDAVWTYDAPGVYDVLLSYDVGDTSGKHLLPDGVEVFDSSSALLFEGGTEHVEVPAAAGLQLAGAFTLEAWIKPYDWGAFAFGGFGYGHVLSKGPVKLYLIGEHFARNNHSLFLDIAHADATVSGTGSPLESIVLDEWQHVAVAYDGTGTVTMWVDGEGATVTYTTLPSGAVDPNAGDPLGIGNLLPELTKGFEGAIDEVRIWDHARDGGDIAADMLVRLDGDEPGLIGYWRLDDASGPAVLDDTGTCGAGAIADAGWVQGVVMLSTGVSEPETVEDGVVGRVAAFPNPFTPRTELSLIIPSTAVVDVAIHDVAGRVVKILGGTTKQAGAVRVPWDGTDEAGRYVASGIYFCHVTAGEYRAVGRLVHIK